jgi:putative transposase
MLSQAQLEMLYDERGYSLETRRLIDRIRTSEPEQRVEGQGGNVVTRYASRKMKRVIQAKSHRNALPHLISFEHNSDVYEFYDQPSTITLRYLDKSGKLTAIRHSPDFFLINSQSAGYVECKTEEQLIELSEKMPNRYVKDKNGRWQCPPGEEYASQFNLFYLVLSDRDINWIFVRNVEHLEDYFDENCPQVDSEIAEQIISVVKENLGITFDDIRAHLPDIPADALLTMIAHEEIYVDLYKAPLTEPGRVQVFSSEAIAQGFLYMQESNSPTFSSSGITLTAGSSLNWDGRGWRILNVGISKTTLTSDQNQLYELENRQLESLILSGAIKVLDPSSDWSERKEAEQLITHADPKDLEKANRRFDEIRPFLSNEANYQHLTPSDARRIRRWKAAYRDAERRYGNGYVGLLPRYHFSGNRSPRFDKVIDGLIQEIIEKDYESIKQKSYTASYGLLCMKCAELGLDAPSYKTFIKKCKKRDTYEQTKKRQGKRAAYKFSPQYLVLERTTPRHGERVFQIGHIDHTPLDIELIHSQTFRNMGRPWLTLLIDAFSRKILAIYLSFESPSYRSCMMVIRECVRLYGRLPQYVIVDGGKEFSSVYFESLLSQYGSHKKERPKAQARNGSVIERIFGTANTKFIHSLSGNTQITKNVRQVTRSVNPKNNAVWDLHRFSIRLREWIDTIYHTDDHPALGQSPQEAFEASLIQSGFREHKLIPYDEAFYLSTLPTTPRGKAKVQPNTGVRVNYFDYWSPYMRDPEVEGTLVEVRYDPYDASVVFAYIKNQWVRCTSSHDNILRGRSETFMSMAAEELRQTRKLHNKNYEVKAAKLAAFLYECDSEELRLQAEKDEALRRITTNGITLEDDPSINHDYQAENAETETSEETLDTEATSRQRQIFGEL